MRLMPSRFIAFNESVNAWLRPLDKGQIAALAATKRLGFVLNISDVEALTGFPMLVTMTRAEATQLANQLRESAAAITD